MLSPRPSQQLGDLVAQRGRRKRLGDDLGRPQAFGGPQKYDGGTMKEIHEGMAITQAQFDAAAGHLKAALEKNKVARKESDEIMAIAGTVAKDIVEKK